MPDNEVTNLFFRKIFIPVLAVTALFISFPAISFGADQIKVQDALQNEFLPEETVENVLCSGPGCLRLLTYLQAQNMISGVEDIEKRDIPIDPRPYFLANPSFKDLSLIGEYRGQTRPELVVSLEEFPQVIFKTFPEMGIPAAKLQEATDVPVIPLEYGNLFNQKEDLYKSIRIMAGVTGKSQRGEEVIYFLEDAIHDLSRRMEGLAPSERRTAYVGGIAYKGPHGIRSTEKGYPPFAFTGTRNVAFSGEELKGSSSQADVSREKILQWDPEVIFVDLSTLNAPKDASALAELMNDPLWRELKAVKSGEVYGVLPYNWYTQNFGSILANAYFVGKALYPESFEDVDPQVKADEIFRFLVGQDVFQTMKQSFNGLAFERLELN